MKFFVISALWLAVASAEVVISNTGTKDATAAAQEEIKKHNQEYANGDSSFLEGENSFEFLSQEEFEREKEGLLMPASERGLGGLIPVDPADRYDEESEQYIARLLSNRAALPSHYDSREHGFVSPVKNQEQCGSCAAFSATAVVESCLYKATNGKNGHSDLAEQFLVDCGFNGKSMNGCNGAYIHAYQEYISKNFNKMPHEYSDLYRNTKPTLKCDSSIPLHNTGAKVTAFTQTYSCNEETLKRMIMETGSVSTAIYASDKSFSGYKSGVFDQCSSTQINHAVTAVGWDDAGDYWIVKNSWGTGWGEGGFFRMKKGTCGIATICASVTCSADGSSPSPVPTTTPPPPPPPGASCDISTLYGNPGINGMYTLTTTVGGKKYVAKVSCTNSVCSPTVEGQSNACVYICGKTSC